jgi:hypothetical protein
MKKAANLRETVKHLCCSILKNYYNSLAFKNTITFAEALWLIGDGALGRKGACTPLKYWTLALVLPKKNINLLVRNKWIEFVCM